MFSILSPQDGHREIPRASQKVVPEQGERVVVKLQVDRLVAVEVVGQQPVAVLAARCTQVGAEAGLPLVGDHMPPRHVKRPPPPNVRAEPARRQTVAVARRLEQYIRQPLQIEKSKSAAISIITLQFVNYHVTVCQSRFPINAAGAAVYPDISRGVSRLTNRGTALGLN